MLRGLANWCECFSFLCPSPPMSILRLLGLFAVLCLMCSCQSSAGSFKITLKDGRQYLCKGRPEFVTKTGYYRYKTFQDRDALLRADEVLMIEEQGA